MSKDSVRPCNVLTQLEAPYIEDTTYLANASGTAYLRMAAFIEYLNRVKRFANII